ncbi:hypothetical protein ACLMAL_16895 [Nocardia sp. CWNU-33]|uniref:hypothetical protein n=1 Tax=Nocardia sp. CWNU-33 TaxID=3392117 RepID=UPI00398E3403
MIVLPGIFGAITIATAQSTGTATAPSVNTGLSWTNVRDSDGVPVANYPFVTDHGGILSPLNSVLYFSISFVVVVWTNVENLGIWGWGLVMELRFLDPFTGILHRISVNLNSVIGTPVLFILCGTVGGSVVAYSVIKGLPGRATSQIVMMLLVAIAGPPFLADPLAEVISPNGVLAQSRNVGIEVAAGLNGDSNPNPDQLIAAMQKSMADNFIRLPLQLINFGHVTDVRPACKAAWSAGAMAGDEGRIKSGMKSCDSAAYAATQNPTFGQLGGVILMLFLSILQVIFRVKRLFQVVVLVFYAIAHSFVAAVGFLSFGLIYGAQNLLIKSLVHSVFAGFKVGAICGLLGLQMLVLNAVFLQANGQVIMVIALAAAVESIFNKMSNDMKENFDRGSAKVANWLGVAAQGSGGGGGGGTALGLGTSGAAGKAHPGLLSRINTDVNTLGGSILMQNLAGNPGFLRRGSREEAKQRKEKLKYVGKPSWEMSNRQSMEKWPVLADAARMNFTVFGGKETIRGVTTGIRGVLDRNGALSEVPGAFLGAKWRNMAMVDAGHHAWQVAEANANEGAYQFEHLGFVTSAMQQAHLAAENIVDNGDHSQLAHYRAAANLGVLEQAVFAYKRENGYPVNLRQPGELAFVAQYWNRGDGAWGTEERMAHIRTLADLGNSKIDRTVNPDGTLTAGAEKDMTRLSLAGLTDMTPEQAQRIAKGLQSDTAKNISAAMSVLADNPENRQNYRDLRWEVWDAGQLSSALKGVSVGDKLPPPDMSVDLTNHDPLMTPVGDLMRANPHLRGRRRP